jgi:hypothetical protein
MVVPRWVHKSRTNEHIEEEMWKDQEESKSIFRMVANVRSIQANAVLTLLDPGSACLIEKWAVVPIPVAGRAKVYGYGAA